MRIAYFVDRFPAISETFVLAQVTGMLDRGHDITIYANRLTPTAATHEAVEQYDLISKVVEVKRAAKNPVRRLLQAMSVLLLAVRCGRLKTAVGAINPFRYGRDAASLRLLIRASTFFPQGPFDIIHCQFGDLGVKLHVLESCGAIRGTLVTSFRGTDAMKNANQDPASFEPLFANGRLFLAVSDTIRQKLISLGCPADKIEILRSGIDLRKFSFRGEPQLHEPVRLISVGRLAPNKGLNYALRAVRVLVDSGLSVRYQVVGDGPCSESLESLADELGICDVVEFTGPVSSAEVVQKLRDSDLVLTPSVTGPDGEQEGLPNTLKEAMAIGVPAIGTSTGGIPELIRHGHNGYLVDEKDELAIVDCIRTVLADREMLKPVVIEARKTVEREYDISELNDTLDRVYLSMAGVA